MAPLYHDGMALFEEMLMKESAPLMLSLELNGLSGPFNSRNEPLPGSKKMN